MGLTGSVAMDDNVCEAECCQKTRQAGRRQESENFAGNIGRVVITEGSQKARILDHYLLLLLKRRCDRDAPMKQVGCQRSNADYYPGRTGVAGTSCW